MVEDWATVEGEERKREREREREREVAYCPFFPFLLPDLFL